MRPRETIVQYIDRSIRNTTARYDDTMATNEKEFMFKKLQGAENYKQWNRDMTFALQDAKLWDHIIGIARRPLELKEMEKNDEDRKEGIYQRWEKPCNRAKGGLHAASQPLVSL